MKLDIEEVKWVNVSKVKLWKDNPRKNEAAAAKLAPLLKQHGIKSPIVVWKKDKTIYKGNTTYKAALLNGMKKVPVAYVDFPSLAAAKAYGIADNKAGEFSEWDDDLLADLMSSKSYQKEGMTGFDKKELNQVLMLPDLDKMNNIAESDTGILATIKLVMKPEKKKVVMAYLERTLGKKFAKSVVIK